MTTDESHHPRAPSSRAAVHGLTVMATKERRALRPGAEAGGKPPPARPSKERLLAQAVDGCLQELVKEGAIDVSSLVERAKHEQRVHERRTWFKRIGVTTTILAAVVAGLALFHDVAARHATGDEQRVVVLEDGSKVELNVRSAMRVEFTAASRDLYLTHGEGIFNVRSDPSRPFRVHAGEAIFEAVGTQFDVRLAPDRTVLAVVEGVVQLKPAGRGSAPIDAPQAALMPAVTAGLGIAVDHAGRAGATTRVDVFALTAWRQSPAFEFTHEPLSEIVDVFNRLDAKPKLIIEGEALRARRLAISFKTANSQALLNYLAGDETLSFIRHGDEVTVRERDR